jgi:hypothetical protein
MNISSAKYVEDENGNKYAINATIEGKDTGVPIQAGNRHYDEIQRQVAAGTLTIQDAD